MIPAWADAMFRWGTRLLVAVLICLLVATAVAQIVRLG